jgi:hypothetical protein
MCRQEETGPSGTWDVAMDEEAGHGTGVLPRAPVRESEPRATVRWHATHWDAARSPFRHALIVQSPAPSLLSLSLSDLKVVGASED